MSKRNFKWDVLELLTGFAYVISKDECKKKENVLEYIEKNKGKDDYQLDDKQPIHEGWCRYEVRSDWENVDGKSGGYVVYEGERPVNEVTGKPLSGSFPVWIVDCKYFF